MDVLLKDPVLTNLSGIYGKQAVLYAVQTELSCIRNAIRSGNPEMMESLMENLIGNIKNRTEQGQEASLKRVLNATGIILHTNLGRAPLGNVQVQAMLEAARGYTNLEYSLEEGKRSSRSAHFAEDIQKVTGAERAAAVNNNAAAVILMLAALAKGKEVAVSRGELIEIGGHFRIPEVMGQSGAILREVGCTNRTRIADYENAIHENTGALLKVHTSNYKILGFTEEVSIEELSELGKKYGLPVLVDLGSGVLVDLEEYGLPHEPTVREMLEKGADVVCFSGDKLLGGTQAGILAGKSAYIKKMECHPLMRAFRLDKCMAAALSSTFRAYQDLERAKEELPVLRMLLRSPQELKAQAEEIKESLEKSRAQGIFRIEESVSLPGGGSMPLEGLPGFALTVQPTGESCVQLAKRLRAMPIPVISHIKDHKVFLEMRTILPGEEKELLEELKQCLEKKKRDRE